MKNVDGSHSRTRSCIWVDSSALVAATTTIHHGSRRKSGVGPLSRIYRGDGCYRAHFIGSRESTGQNENKCHVESKHFGYPIVWYVVLVSWQWP